MSKERLIQGLNDALAAEWGAVMRYTYQSSKAFGLQGKVLREALAPEIQDELSHAKYLCDVIVDLGGEPTTAAVGFEKPDDVQDMLELNIKTELDDEAHYTMLAGLAGADGLVELKLKLEEMAADEAAHARQWRRMRKS